MKKVLLAFTLIPLLAGQALAVTQQQSGSVGVEGTIPSKPPRQAPVITSPTNGQVFDKTPITVAGLCSDSLLIEIFKNDVFAGSVQCSNGSFTLQIDLFSDRNDLIARAYDSLNQASPDSNKVTVFLRENIPNGGPRISLISEFSKRGAPPGEILTWPLSISGGNPPYAISVDWGDKTAPDLLSLDTAGAFKIQHTYNQSGVYNLIIRASDSKGGTAFLQLVGLGNGPIQQSSAKTQPAASEVSVWVWIILAAIVLPLLLLSFWFGKRHQLQTIRDRIRRNLPPF